MSDEINVNLIGNYIIELDEQGPPGAPGLGIESVTNVDYDPQTGVYTYRITYTDGTYYDFEIQGGDIYTFSTGLSVEDKTVSVNFSEVATATQGGKADTAVQPADLQSALLDKLDVDPDGVNDLITNNKINLVYVPDILLGQMLYAGTFVPTTAVATLTTNAKAKLGTSDATITLTNDTTDITGYEANEGNFYLASADGTFASIDFLVGDWLVSTGDGWGKIDNTDAVTGVKGNAEQTYRIGNVNITADNVLPAQTSNNGKYLKTNGTTCSWESLPQMVGADGVNPGSSGLVPAPLATDNAKFLAGDGTYKTPTDTTYTFSTGLTNTNNTIKVEDYNKLVKNRANSIRSLAISGSGLSTVGSNSSYSVVVGDASSVGNACSHGIALGGGAVVSGNYGMQIGHGSNTEARTLYVGFGTNEPLPDEEEIVYQYKLLDGITGKIPNARINIDATPTSGSTNAISSGAVYDTLGDIETLLQGV